MELAHGLWLKSLDLVERIKREVEVEFGVKHHAPRWGNRSLAEKGHVLLASLVNDVGWSMKQCRGVDRANVTLS